MRSGLRHQEVKTTRIAIQAHTRNAHALPDQHAGMA
nr:MAG TPA: hypothetical protein [Caudoviricetes sp.]